MQTDKNSRKDMRERHPAKLRELSGWPARAYALIFLGVGILTWVKDCVKSALLPKRRLAPFDFATHQQQREAMSLAPNPLLSENERAILELSQSMVGAKGLVTDFAIPDPSRDSRKSGSFEFIFKDRRQADSIELRAMGHSRPAPKTSKPVIVETILVDDFKVIHQEADNSDGRLDKEVEKTIFVSSHLPPKNPN